MKKEILLLLIATGLVMSLKIEAQTKSVQISKFEYKPTDLTPRTNPVLDNTGSVCAIIRFWHSGSDYIIEPNSGFLKKVEYPGETRLWVPPIETKRITIRHKLP